MTCLALGGKCVVSGGIEASSPAAGCRGKTLTAKQRGQSRPAHGVGSAAEELPAQSRERT